MVAVVLLGAGASFGSRDVLPEPPPLGRGLFPKLELLGGVAASLSEDLKALFREDFEAGMARYFEGGGDIAMFQRELALYLAQFRPGSENVYSRLIQELGIKRVIYCSLNYDMLFEEAAARLGFNIAYSLLPPDNKHVRLIKLHGSCNVWPAVDISVHTNIKFFGNKNDVEAPVVALDRMQTIVRCQKDSSFAPSMAMFAVGKAVRMCPSWVATQHSFWLESLKRATTVFIVGVRVHPVDEHIWNALATCRADVVYFGVTDNDLVEFEDWKSNTKKRNVRFQKADFLKSVSFMRKAHKGS